jgi:hypothetical protein
VGQIHTESLVTEFAAGKQKPWTRWWRRYVLSFKENRAAERKALGVAAELWWTNEDGAEVMTRAICVDRSATGIGLVCRTAVPAQVPVAVKLQSEIIAHRAYLRHCGPVGGGYLVGLQFAAGT